MQASVKNPVKNWLVNFFSLKKMEVSAIQKTGLNITIKEKRFDTMSFRPSTKRKF